MPQERHAKLRGKSAATCAADGLAARAAADSCGTAAGILPRATWSPAARSRTTRAAGLRQYRSRCVPPWATTIRRAMGRPRPVPRCLVVKNGSNTLLANVGRHARALIGNRDDELLRLALDADRDVAGTAQACAAFISTFVNTSCSCSASADVTASAGGKVDMQVGKGRIAMQQLQRVADQAVEVRPVRTGAVAAARRPAGRGRCRSGRRAAR